MAIGEGGGEQAGRDSRALERNGDFFGMKRGMDGIAGTGVGKPEIKNGGGGLAAAAAADGDAGGGEFPQMSPRIGDFRKVHSRARDGRERR